MVSGRAAQVRCTHCNNTSAESLSYISYLCACVSVFDGPARDGAQMPLMHNAMQPCELSTESAIFRYLAFRCARSLYDRRKSGGVEEREGESKNAQ